MKFRTILLVVLLLATSPAGPVAAGEGQGTGVPIGSSSYRLSLQAGQQPGGQNGPAAPALIGNYGPALLERLLSRRTAGFVLDGATIVAATTSGDIHRSTNGGATWRGAATPPASGRIRGLAAHPASRSTIYAATNGGVFTSSDAGDSWSACGTAGLPAAALNVVSVAVDPAGTVYAGTEAGIFSSSNCASWNALNRGLQVSATALPVAIAVDPVAPNRLYAGLDGRGIFTSSDRGKTWTPAATQPVNKRIRALAVKPGDGARLFAATYGNGVFASTDHGVTWSACKNAGLVNGNVGSLLLDADGTLYAGTDRGVFMSEDGCVTWTTLLGGDPL
jgi:photosystem II stability/assembly factor-like uncharacterized protein